MTDPQFLRRTGWAVGILLLAAAAGLLLWHALHFVLLVFGGVLLGVFLHGLSAVAAERTGLNYPGALAVVGVLLVAALGGLAWLVGPDLVRQLTLLVERIPAAVADIGLFLEERGWGRAVLDRLPRSMDAAGATPADLLGRITGLFSTTLGAAVNLLIVLFLGLYLALEPRLYRRGLLHVVPPRHRELGARTLDALQVALQRWLLGRFASMAVVAALTAMALLVLGVPLVLGLSALAGLLSFVPLLGPAAAAIPAVLLGWGEGGPQLALWVGLAYWIVQLVESYLITPMIQKWAVSMPPALLVASQILMGLAAGVLGVLLATPLTVVAVVLVQTLWVGETLGDDVEPLGAH